MFRRVLDAEMKVACKAGVEKKNKKAEREAVTEEEEKIMWDKNLLGCQTAKSLVRTTYFYNGKLFGIRSKNLQPFLAKSNEAFYFKPNNDEAVVEYITIWFWALIV